MKIANSNVTMKSERSYYSRLEQHSETLTTTSDKAATLEFSEESKSLVEQMREYKQEQKKQSKQQAKEQEEKNAKAIATAMAEAEKARQNQPGISVDSKEDLELQTLKRILEMLRSMREGKGSMTVKDAAQMAKQTKQQTNFAMSASGSFSASAGFGVSAGTITSSGSHNSVTTWKKITVQSSFYAEMEHTAYQSQGLVRTEDGREINFNVQVEMSQAFCEKYDSMLVEDYVCVDPLVFNLKGDVGQISDQKFLFDLNADGEEEEISFTEYGSGFLALDKNKDGKINDGSELFGTKSGDGFRDLAAYDEDGNGWIDENDAIFNDLSIWTLNESGEKVLLSLKEADVGAIYLGNASTEFSLKNADTHKTNGVIRNTGIYLKESGGAGTVQHIDLTI